MSHIAPITMKAANATLTAYRGVVLSAANTVKHADTVTALPLGITGDDVLAADAGVPVYVAGIAKLYFNDTVTTGGLVALDSVGRGVAHSDVTAGSYVIGSLIGPTVAATGTIAEVLINPFFKSIP